MNSSRTTPSTLTPEAEQSNSEMRLVDACLYQVMRQTDEMVMITDHLGRIEYVNPALLDQTGYSETDLLGSTPSILSSGEQDAAFYDKMWQTLLAGHCFRGLFINRRHNGECYYEEKTITPVRDAKGVIRHFVATGRDITAQMDQERCLYDLRSFDTLTGLPNRQRLAEQFEQHVVQHKRTPLALFLIDLDRLSRINDSLGRSAGDEILRRTGERLKKYFVGHLSGRLGSDAFMLLVHGIQTPDQASHIAQQIRKEIARPFRLPQAELYMSASLGITLYPYDGDQFDELVNKADSAMHRCKELEQSFGFFTDDLTQQTQDRVRMENQLRQALLRKEFYLLFQPRIDLNTGSVQGAEALLRWARPDGRQVSPAEFIPILEETGLITSVGEWVLMRSCIYARQWLDRGYALRISVNLSARQLRQADLLDGVNRCLERSQLPADCLELELTETSMLDNVEHSIEHLSQLRAQGIRIAIDDFGTGYSSLAYLKRLPADTLKIDRAFIKELESRNPTDLSIVQSIIQLAHNLGLSVTAEGIETAHQLEQVKQLGADEAQGFLLAPPLTETELLNMQRRFSLDRFLANLASG